MKSRSVPLHRSDRLPNSSLIRTTYIATELLCTEQNSPRCEALCCLLSDIETDTKGPNSFGSIHPVAERGSNDQWPRRVSVNLRLHSAVSRNTLGFSVRGGWRRGGWGRRIKVRGRLPLVTRPHRSWLSLYFYVSYVASSTPMQPNYNP